MKRRILIDCDPGIDDALAILMALAAPELDVVGVTTVGGNVGVDATTRNALALATLAGRRVPVARGADTALVVDKKRAESVHGADGLGGVPLPAPAYAAEEAPAWEFIRDRAAEFRGELEIVAIGPLTNVALALSAYPETRERIKAIHLMGGSIGFGNATPAAEFNIVADPHAAAAVFQSGVPITMFGLDVTNRANLSAEGLEELRAVGGRALSPCCSMLDHYLAAYRSFGRDALALHDPLVVAWLIDPSLVETRPYRVDVETDGRYTSGKTIVDVHGVSKRPPNAEVGVELDAERFIALLTRLLRSYDEPGAAGPLGTD
ncbi:MAG: pyrimidine-specific ribonucleoside hydrolase RihA [Spirochaetae bacterium HGW-Spirochaetae-3]|jgi:pyrimidine-specific ribonucleoside hydrolase|nr:MAG: pyrimidine-specific ribonucleoside hydrolase RihA [Spirochaetae bacterium HGW-Spirochaetae-3]